MDLQTMGEEGKKAEFDHNTNEEIASILESNVLSSEEKSALLASYWREDDISSPEFNKFSTSIAVFEEKSRHTEELKRKNVEDCLSLDSSQQEKPSGALDPLTIEEIASILESKLEWNEIQLIIACTLLEEENIFASENDMSRSSVRDNIQGETQYTEEKTKEDRDNIHNDGTSKWIDESSLRQQGAKRNVDLELKEGEHACNQIQEDIPPSEFGTSSTSSRIELEDKNQHTEMKQGSSSLRAQAITVKGFPRWKEMKENFLTVISITNNGEAVESNVDGKSIGTRIHKEEAVCKYCLKYVFRENLSDQPEENVLKAKCGCKVVLLIHENCSSLWSGENGDKCTACDHDITYVGVSVSLENPPETSGQKVDQKPSLKPNSRFWCCLGNA